MPFLCPLYYWPCGKAPILYTSWNKPTTDYRCGWSPAAGGAGGSGEDALGDGVAHGADAGHHHGLVGLDQGVEVEAAEPGWVFRAGTLEAVYAMPQEVARRRLDSEGDLGQVGVRADGGDDLIRVERIGRP
jgi:hypothetical protein